MSWRGSPRSATASRPGARPAPAVGHPGGGMATTQMGATRRARYGIRGRKMCHVGAQAQVQSPGPPSSPLGTYPSGGVDRVVYLYGLIAYLLWREFSWHSQGKAWAIGAVAALSFNEAYSRELSGKHWTSEHPQAGCSTARSCSRRSIAGGTAVRRSGRDG